jgi:hypothetical protein
MSRALASVDLTGQLTRDELASLDEALDEIGDGMRLAIVRQVGQGRPRAGIVSRAFACVRLNRAGAQTRHAFLLKLGEPDRLADDFAKWSRHLFPRTPVMLRPHGNVLLMELIGETFTPFATVARDEPMLLDAGLRALFDEWLHDLHRHLCSDRHGVPTESHTLRAALFEAENGHRPRIDERDRAAARETLASELGDRWTHDETIEDAQRGYRCHNWVKQLMDSGNLPGADRPCLLPHGIVHGDLNLDNLFLSAERLRIRRGDEGRIQRHAPHDEQTVALIDYERLDLGCVFDDLARLECELVLSALPVASKRPPHADTGLVAVTACWPWDMRHALPVGLTVKERELCRALATIRSAAAAVATVAMDRDPAALQRGYYACLLGRAFSYLWYDHVSVAQRPRAAELCLLLAARLADEKSEPPRARFPDLLQDASNGERRGVDENGDRILDGTNGHTAVRIGNERISDVHVTAELTLEAVVGSACKLGVVKGGRRQRGKIDGDVVGAWVTLSDDKWWLRLERSVATNPRARVSLQSEPVGRRLELSLSCVGSQIEAVAYVDAEAPARAQIQFRPPVGDVFVVAEGCRARIRGLRALA